MRGILVGHDGAHQTQNRVEFRKGGVDQGIRENIVALGNAHDTVGANLTLTDAGDQAGEAHAGAHTEAEGSGNGAGGEFAQQNEEGDEAVDTLGGRESGKLLRDQEHHP